MDHWSIKRDWKAFTSLFQSVKNFGFLKRRKDFQTFGIRTFQKKNHNLSFSCHDPLDSIDFDG